MALITCQDIALGYDGKKIVDHINFSVNIGDYLCIVGENGSGKSTLIKTILGLIPPVNGQIRTGDGMKSTQIGYLPQHSLVQRDFPASVSEVVLSGCLNHCGMRPFYNRAEKQLAMTNMKKLGVDKIAKRCYRELSGGQQQRTLLARALCATGKLLLLDEPVAGLDPNATTDMYQIIESLNREDGTAVIMISHDIASAIKYASHILHIGNQKTLFYGTKQMYLQTELGKSYGSTNGGQTSWQ